MWIGSGVDIKNRMISTFSRQTLLQAIRGEKLKPTNGHVTDVEIFRYVRQRLTGLQELIKAGRCALVSA
jgi:hypothetical protein